MCMDDIDLCAEIPAVRCFLFMLIFPYNDIDDRNKEVIWQFINPCM